MNSKDYSVIQAGTDILSAYVHPRVLTGHIENDKTKVSTQYTNVTDTQTDRRTSHGNKYRAMQRRAVKNVIYYDHLSVQTTKEKFVSPTAMISVQASPGYCPLVSLHWYIPASVDVTLLITRSKTPFSGRWILNRSRSTL